MTGCGRLRVVTAGSFKLATVEIGCTKNVAAGPGNVSWAMTTLRTMTTEKYTLSLKVQRPNSMREKEVARTGMDKGKLLLEVVSLRESALSSILRACSYFMICPC